MKCHEQYNLVGRLYCYPSCRFEFSRIALRANPATRCAISSLNEATRHYRVTSNALPWLIGLPPEDCAFSQGQEEIQKTAFSSPRFFILRGSLLPLLLPPPAAALIYSLLETRKARRTDCKYVIDGRSKVRRACLRSTRFRIP